jgi:hypothetical protein
MLPNLLQKLRKNDSRLSASAERTLLYIGTHGITLLLLTGLLVAVVLLD